MLARIRQCLLFTIFLVLPLQGIASVVASLTCGAHEHEQMNVEAADFYAHALAHDAGLAHHHSDDRTDGGPNGDHSNHLCCHYFSSAAVTSLGKPSAPAQPVFSPSFSLLATLFIPEKPQRPPRG